MLKPILLLLTHLGAAGLGFALGIYALPILTAPPGPDTTMIDAAQQTAAYTGEFKRDLADSDMLHWGEGRLFVSTEAIAFEGALAPGPDYRLYLSPRFVETEAEFEALKAEMAQVGHVRTFENFLVSVPASIDPEDYTAVIIWCESFGQFITAATYR